MLRGVARHFSDRFLHHFRLLNYRELQRNGTRCASTDTETGLSLSPAFLAGVKK